MVFVTFNVLVNRPLALSCYSVHFFAKAAHVQGPYLLLVACGGNDTPLGCIPLSEMLSNSCVCRMIWPAFVNDPIEVARVDARCLWTL